MNYYYIFDSKKIIKFDEPVVNPSDYNLIAFTAEQTTFYNENPTAKLSEILNLQMNTPQEYVPTLQDLKNQRIEEENMQFQQFIEAGYYDETENITLAIQYEDRSAFTQLLSMLKLAEDLGQGNPETVDIADINQAVHTLNLIPLKALLLRYGFYYQTIWTQHVAKKQAIQQAETIEQLELL